MYWGGDEGLATLLAETADQAGPWPGLRQMPERRVRLVLTRDQWQFDSLTRGRVPEWGGAAAFPGSNTIILKVNGDPRATRRVLRHELAHLALHEQVQRVPRWFDEGYAARAAGEWSMRDALTVNWAILRGVRPSLSQIDRALRGQGAADASAGYALATTAVLHLERLGADRGLAPLLRTLESTVDFDAALRTTHQMTLGQSEVQWHKELGKRYGWLQLLTSMTMFWVFAAVVLVALWSRRRLRDRDRRAALESDWVTDADGATPDA